MTGAENLRLMTDLNHLGRIEGRRGRASCSSASTSRTQRKSLSRPTQEGCDAGWT